MNTLHLEITVGVFTPIKSMSKRIFKALNRNPIESATIYRWCAVNRETIDAFCSRAVKESAMRGQGAKVLLMHCAYSVEGCSQDVDTNLPVAGADLVHFGVVIYRTSRTQFGFWIYWAPGGRFTNLASGLSLKHT